MNNLDGNNIISVKNIFSTGFDFIFLIKILPWQPFRACIVAKKKIIPILADTVIVIWITDMGTYMVSDYIMRNVFKFFQGKELWVQYLKYKHVIVHQNKQIRCQLTAHAHTHARAWNYTKQEPNTFYILVVFQRADMQITKVAGVNEMTTHCFMWVAKDAVQDSEDIGARWPVYIAGQ